MSPRTAAGYAAAFAAERANRHPVMDEMEARLGFSVDRQRLEDAARVLACPLKKNPPSWQHGRLIYAVGCRYLADHPKQPQTWIDIGTAKGFSACAMTWAMAEMGCPGDVLSYDIIDPHSREPRNSCEDGRTVYEFVAPFAALGVFVSFMHSSVLRAMPAMTRVNLAFIDGSHTYDGVRQDIELVSSRQQAGDVIVFDDMQVAGIRRAVCEPWSGGYIIEEIELIPHRRYALAVRQ